MTTSPLPSRGICAHRGAMTSHPENTLPAFEEAIRLQVQMIEFDVHQTKDGRLVVMHDATVDSTTNGTGTIAEMTLAEIRQLEAAVQHGGKFPGTRVPTLEEALAVMPRNIWINCELKAGATFGGDVARTILEAGRERQAFLACRTEAIADARAVSPDILICNMNRREDVRDYVADTLAMKAAFIQFTHRNGMITPELTQPLREAGVRINYFHATTAEQFEALFAAGADFVMANDIAPFLPKLRELGIGPTPPEFQS